MKIKFVAVNNISINNNLFINRLLVFPMLFFFCCCLSYCSVFNIGIKSNKNKTIIPLLHDTVFIKYDQNQVSNLKRMTKCLPSFSTLVLFNGDLIIENNYQYSNSNSRINLTISGKNIPELIYINQKSGTTIEVENFKIKILGLEKIEDDYEPKLLIINTAIEEKELN